jgi:hypothetical protein
MVMLVGSLSRLEEDVKVVTRQVREGQVWGV